MAKYRYIAKKVNLIVFVRQFVTNRPLMTTKQTKTRSFNYQLPIESSAGKSKQPKQRRNQMSANKLHFSNQTTPTIQAHQSPAPTKGEEQTTGRRQSAFSILFCFTKKPTYILLSANSSTHMTINKFQQSTLQFRITHLQSELVIKRS